MWTKAGNLNMKFKFSEGARRKMKRDEPKSRVHIIFNCMKRMKQGAVFT